ncbi:MAG: FAD-dependent monooxygenase [Chloroflexi bacterium]|nr:FAD-dependent monooxygenase [Chloroflexota bacterium]
MNFQFYLHKNQNKPAKPAVYKHAIVIGGSIAGLTTARVLTDHFEQVTVIERDGPSDATEFRKGAPQARHPHALLARGQQILEQQFPGLVAELIEGGAVPMDMGRDFAFFIDGAWCQPYQSKIMSTACSRPRLESAIYRRLAAHPKVRFMHEQEVLGLCVDEQKVRVTGIQLRERGNPMAAINELAADLVVDASGRDSHAPQWLESLGYTAPQETMINAFPGYATRIFKRPADFKETWKGLYILAMAPNHSRGAVIMPLEGDRWHVCLVGMAGDYPPTDEEGFWNFLRSLPSSRFYDVLKEAEPLTAPYGYRRAENRLRYFEKLPRHLEGFLATGDAVYAFNPVYGQGMTVAAMASLALDECLKAQRHQHGDQTLGGLAKQFQTKLAGVIAGPWQMATGQDVLWPACEGGQKPDRITQMINGYMERVIRTMPYNIAVADAFFHVQNMLKPPTSLFHPKVLWNVLRPGSRQPALEQRVERVMTPEPVLASGD